MFLNGPKQYISKVIPSKLLMHMRFIVLTVYKLYMRDCLLNILAIIVPIRKII